MELLTINDRGVSRELRMYIPGWLARTESQCGSPKGPVAAAACKPSLFSLETHPTLPWHLSPILSSVDQGRHLQFNSTDPYKKIFNSRPERTQLFPGILHQL